MFQTVTACIATSTRRPGVVEVSYQSPEHGESGYFRSCPVETLRGHLMFQIVTACTASSGRRTGVVEEYYKAQSTETQPNVKSGRFKHHVAT